MPRHSLAWPVLELLDEELNGPFDEEPEPASEPAPLLADAFFMAACDVFLTRDGADAFTLTLKHRGQTSEIHLKVGIDERGMPSLLALVA